MKIKMKIKTRTRTALFKCLPLSYGILLSGVTFFIFKHCTEKIHKNLYLLTCVCVCVGRGNRGGESPQWVFCLKHKDA